MKFFAAICILTLTVGCNASSDSSKKTLPVYDFEKIGKVGQDKKAEQKVETKKEEDCDEKAKKVIEIKEESISLTGNAGCSLDKIK